jgi:sugar lactone lactonase YvrE
VNIELVLDSKAIIGESPIWVAEEGAIYWVDIKAPSLHRMRLDGSDMRSWAMPADIGAYALDGKGSALVALRTGLFWFDLATHALTLAVAAPFDPNITRFNEGACDSTGRFWIGTMTDPLDGTTPDEKGMLYSYTSKDGLIAYEDFSFLANGMAWSADETSFFLSHSYAQKVFTFAFDKQSGALSNRSVFCELLGEKGIPDGAAMDSAGFYWCAVHGGWKLHRYAPDGQLDQVIELPVSQPTMCCFAGENLDELYITSAHEKLSTEQLKAEPHAGGLFRLKPEMRGQRKYYYVD